MISPLKTALLWPISLLKITEAQKGNEFPKDPAPGSLMPKWVPRASMLENKHTRAQEAQVLTEHADGAGCGVTLTNIQQRGVIL